jgi:hypothetical protein
MEIRFNLISKRQIFMIIAKIKIIMLVMLISVIDILFPKNSKLEGRGEGGCG